MSSWLTTLFGVAEPTGAAVLLGMALLAGFVRGFVGFGAGMVFVPVAASIVGPTAAVGIIWTIDVPITLRYAAGSIAGSAWREILPLTAGALTGLPIGMWLLTSLDPTAVRWGTSAFILVSVAALGSGWRYRRTPGVVASYAVGTASGLTTGIVGLGGPFIALFWLGGRNDPARVKQNLNTYFLVTTVTIAPAFVAKGIITLDLALHTIPLILAYTAAALTGTYGFRRWGGASYRPAVLAMAAAAAITGLPLLDGWFGR